MTEKLLAIDPGVKGTGWALLSRTRPYVLRCGTLTPTVGGEEWLDRAMDIAHNMYELVFEIPGLTGFVVEFPRYMGNIGGQMVAQRGDLVKLSVLVGMLIQSLMAARPELSVKVVEPSKWKGQLPKDVTRERVQRICGMKFNEESEHAIDAIGIGLWAIGKF